MFFSFDDTQIYIFFLITKAFNSFLLLTFENYKIMQINGFRIVAKKTFIQFQARTHQRAKIVASADGRFYR